jgi:hypothetical protein
VTRPPSPEEPDRIEFERRPLWELIPPRTLVRVVSLLVILATIVYLQARSGSLARKIGDALFPAPPAAPRPREAPRARIEPAPAAAPASRVAREDAR